MLTGWVHDGDDWYYLTSDGSLLTNAYTPDGYWVDAEGEWDGLDDRFDDDWDDRFDDDRDDDWDDRFDDDHDDDWDDRFDDDHDDDWDDRFDD